MDSKQVVLGLLVISVLVIAGVINQVQIGGKTLVLNNPQSLAIATGCKLISNSETAAEQFICDTDQCEVQGKLTCDVPIGSSKVTLRCGSGWFAWDKGTGGSLVYFAQTGIRYGSQVGTLAFTCQDGSKFALYNGFYLDSAGNAYSEQASPNPTYIQSAPLGGNEKISGGTGYSCNWRFCPSADYCDKVESASASWTKGTSSIFLQRGGDVSFKPTDGNNVLLNTAKSVIIYSKYDCSCVSQCKEGAKVCTGTNSYSLCTASTSGGCNAQVGSYSCPSGQTCQHTTTGDTCGCPTTASECSEGTRRCVGTNQYQICQQVTLGSCTAWKWGTATNCPSDQVQLICNPDTTSTTICKESTPICSTLDTRCVSTTTYQVCTTDSNGAHYYATQACPANTLCTGTKCTACTGSDVCSTYSIVNGVCTPTKIANCCTGSTCAVGYTCVQNRCVRDTGVCLSNSDCTSPRTCDTSSHACICPTTGVYCAGNEDARCKSGSQVEVCAMDPSTGCYKWALGPTCTLPQICVQHSPATCQAPGQVSLSLEPNYPVNKIIKVPVQIDGSIGDLSGNQVQMTIYDSQGNALSVANCILTKNVISGLYACTAEFANGLSATGTYTLKAVTSVSGVTLESSSQFNVYIGVGVLIYTDTVESTHEDGVAILSVKDENGNPVSSFDRWVVEVKVNNAAVSYNLIPQVEAGKVKLTYSLPGPGPVYIKASTSGGQLAPTSDERSDIIAKSPEIILDYNFPSSVNYGTNKFEFKTWVSNNDPDVEKVPLDIPMTALSIVVDYPNKPTETIHPIRAAKGSYYFNLDMPEENGQAYSMTITAVYSNWLTKTTPVIYVSAQPGTSTPLPSTDWTMYVIIGLGVLLVVVLAMVGIFRRRR